MKRDIQTKIKFNYYHVSMMKNRSGLKPVDEFILAPSAIDAAYKFHYKNPLSQHCELRESPNINVKINHDLISQANVAYSVLLLDSESMKEIKVFIG